MPKNIVILFDGTSNGIDTDRTNVLRLYGVLEKSDRQLVWYDPGVGTFGADNAWSRLWRKAVEIWGLATGWGLDRNVQEAYKFLVRNYCSGEPDEEGSRERDRIHLIGFSRGAYSARVLAGFLHNFGLMKEENFNLLGYAYRAYKRIGEKPGEHAFAEIRLYERILRPDRPPIRMLALFDTVASVIESGRFGPRLRSHASTSANPSVQSVIHAVAIDERRTMFRPLLWPSGNPWNANRFGTEHTEAQEVREVWFAGCHGDVGGGFPEKESGLCKVALEWLLGRAMACGIHATTRSVNLVVRGRGEDTGYVPPDPTSEAHNSMCGFWPVIEFLPRRRPADSPRPSLFGLTLPLFERRAMPPGACLHPSVISRRDSGGKWSANIPDDHTVWIEPETAPRWK